MLLNAFLQFQLSLSSVFNVSLFTSRNNIIYTVLILFSFTLQHCSSSLCGGNIGTRSGVITSPLYSNTSYVNCKWFISANKWEKISLKFTSFYIGKETSPSTSSCDSYLEVLDGKDRIEKYCKGWNIHPKDTITSETSSMTLILKAKNNNGNIMLTFKASFETHCTGLFTSQKDEIVSPNYPGVYPVPQYCSWKIRVPPDSVIRLHFLEFNLERTPQCNRDYVRIIDGLNSSSSRQIGPYFCANRPPPKQIRSTGNTMTLDFKAFKPTTTGRFHFYYAAEPHCGGYLRGNFGSFTSPGYTNPLYRTRNKDCIWTIEVPTEMVVSVVFATFDVKSSVRCTYDYVEIFDGSDVSATSKGRYCGSQVTNPPTVRSTKNTFTIKLHRSSSNPGRGFYATYVAVDPKNPLDKCTEASGGIVFQCNNGNYIQCFWKCDGTDDCGDGSDEQYCNDQEITKPPNKGKTSYVIILVSITSSAILIAVVIFLVDRLRRKRRSQASSRRRRRRRARMRALDSGDFRDMASPPPTYDSAVFPSSCCDAASFPPTYAESMMTTSMSEVAENTTQTVIISDVEQTGNNQGEHTQQEANNDQVITEEHGQAIEAGVEVDCVSLGESPPTSDTSPLIV